jgi:hypothetical protein
VDEVLAVGDALFRLKCLERMRELVRGGTTLVFVTHDLDQMQAICRRAIVLDKGRVCFEGSARDAVGHYLRAMAETCAERPADVGCGPHARPIALRRLRWVDAYGAEVVALEGDGPLAAEITFETGEPTAELVVELNMRAASNDPLLSFNSARSGAKLQVDAGETRVVLSIPSLPVAAGQYFWNVRVWDAVRGEVILDTPFQHTLLVHRDRPATGMLCLDHSWRCDDSHAAVGEAALAESQA